MKMRIISGNFKGRFINVPNSELIRPTTDRVRETLFNLLNNKINFVGINVLDLYSGSGSLGLECISRGAKHATFIEKNFQIYKNLLENIKSLEVDNKCKIIKSAVLDFCKIPQEMKYHIIFADPPYMKDEIYKVVENVRLNNYLNDDSIMIIERSIHSKLQDIENFNTEPLKVIGDTCLYEIHK